jgi:uncharacterized membrane protein (UPF0127 family)
MANLLNKSKNQMILEDLSVAETFWPRLIGLLGRSGLSTNQGLWIKRCNSIHTWSMKFTIDCVFVDHQLRVKSVVHEVRPWRWVWPRWGSDSVFELAAGTAREKNIEVGDVLYVGR